MSPLRYINSTVLTQEYGVGEQRSGTDTINLHDILLRVGNPVAVGDHSRVTGKNSRKGASVISSPLCYTLRYPMSLSNTDLDPVMHTLRRLSRLVKTLYDSLTVLPLSARTIVTAVGIATHPSNTILTPPSKSFPSF